MGYYMRYFVCDQRPVSLSELDAGLRSLDPAYSIVLDGKYGELRHGDGLYGLIEINFPGDDVFEKEILEEIELIKDNPDPSRDQVINALKSVKSTIAIQVFYQDRDAETTFRKLDSLWEWLFANRQGLFQADGDEYYEQSGLILETGWN